VEEARVASSAADYLIAGTVFPTPSKPDVTSGLGLDGLRGIARSVTVPVLAIGGITRERLDEVAASGAAGIAAIGLFCTRDGLASINEAIRSRFDTLKAGS
jgi:thiamine monophosphate synthase